MLVKMVILPSNLEAKMEQLFGQASEAQFLFQIAETGFRVTEFTALEKLSAPYEVALGLASEDEVKLDDVMGKEALLTIVGEEANRYFHGIINQFVQVGSKGRFFLYQAKLVPSLWLLSLEQDCRIFQDKTVKDIISTVLKEAGITSDRFDFRLQNQYEKMEYCVQYRETDLNFISRLLEEHGIFYFFEHSQDKHLLVFGDSTVNYKPVEGDPKVLFHPADSRVPGEEFVSSFHLERQIRSGKVTLRDFNFEKPSLDLTSQEQAQSDKKLEIYDYPGGYKEGKEGKRLAKLRLERSQATRDSGFGQSYCPRFVPGMTFQLTDHDFDSLNQEYLLVEVNHRGEQPQVLEEKAETDRPFHYSNAFICIPSSVQYRPLQELKRPLVQGLQTAIVTGPKNEEIYTDEYGRVKVQFHWDREGKRDENTTCWLRVAQLWAGAGWGTVFIPRVGDEVLVDFLEGNPNRPLVVGSVYNKQNQPLYPLPDEKTKSTIKTKSYPNDPGFNELRFEDKKGEEEIFIHAEKDMNNIVKNDMSISVGNNQTTSVRKDRSATVKEGNDTLTITQGTRTVTVKGNTSLTVQAGNRSVDVTGGDYSLNVNGGGIKGTASGGGVEMTGIGGTGVKLTGTPSFEANGAATAKILSPVVEIGNNIIRISGVMIQLSAGGSTLTIDPSGITMSTGGIITETAAIIKHNV
ncbi:MAG: type VI secretion system tip protein VgrG [Deltaproteobacteria bacterium]|nr:MAG: type VI secretion system tip protein VgrG [Deltaproteobacteria bacterium]